jgi:hypothetical protein
MGERPQRMGIEEFVDVADVPDPNIALSSVCGLWSASLYTDNGTACPQKELGNGCGIFLTISPIIGLYHYKGQRHAHLMASADIPEEGGEQRREIGSSRRLQTAVNSGLKRICKVGTTSGYLPAGQSPIGIRNVVDWTSRRPASRNFCAKVCPILGSRSLCINPRYVTPHWCIECCSVKRPLSDWIL